MRYFSSSNGNIVIINGNNNGTITNSSNGVVTVNGKVISGVETAKTFSYDETKVIDGKIASVIVESTVAHVRIIPTESSDATIIYRGYASVIGDASFEVKNENRVLIVKSLCNGAFIDGALHLDIMLPNNYFQSISVKTVSANVTLNCGVMADTIKLSSQSGRVESKASFKNASISTMSGNVVLYDKTDEDFDVNVSTMSGDVSVNTKDVSSLNLSTNTMSGRVNNYHHMPARKGKSANIVINTMSGDISIV